LKFLLLLFPFVERFSELGLGLTVLAGFVASDPVVTSLAGFAGGRRPHAPGGRTPCFFFFAQDVAHTDEGYSESRRNQRPGPYSRWPVFK
jgi:hypothetical protein